MPSRIPLFRIFVPRHIRSTVSVFVPPPRHAHANPSVWRSLLCLATRCSTENKSADVRPAHRVQPSGRSVPSQPLTVCYTGCTSNRRWTPVTILFPIRYLIWRVGASRNNMPGWSRPGSWCTRLAEARGNRWLFQLTTTSSSGPTLFFSTSTMSVSLDPSSTLGFPSTYSDHFSSHAFALSSKANLLGFQGRLLRP